MQRNNYAVVEGTVHSCIQSHAWPSTGQRRRPEGKRSTDESAWLWVRHGSGPSQKPHRRSADASESAAAYPMRRRLRSSSLKKSASSCEMSLSMATPLSRSAVNGAAQLPSAFMWAFNISSVMVSDGWAGWPMAAKICLARSAVLDISVTPSRKHMTSAFSSMIFSIRSAVSLDDG